MTQLTRSRLPLIDRSGSGWGRRGRSFGTFLIAAVASACQTTKVSGQRLEPSERCNAAACEDQTMLLLAIDAAIEKADFCRERPTRVLSTLYSAPFTAAGDGARGRGPRNGVPSSPASLRLEDLGLLSARRFHHDVTIVDSAEVLDSARVSKGCLIVASPPTARANGEMRVVIAITEASTGELLQLFLFLRRDGERWVVTRSEVGFRT